MCCRPALRLPAPTSLTVHCVAARLAEPVRANYTNITAAEGNGDALFEPIFETEVDFFEDKPAACGSKAMREAWESRLVDEMAGRAASVRRGRAQAARADKRSAMGRAERSRPAAPREIWICCRYEKRIRLTGADHASARGPCGCLGVSGTL